MTTPRFRPCLAAGLLALAALALPATAEATVATTTKQVHLRAGPARDYPVVAILHGGAEVDVQGCIDAYSWCDVIYDGLRGWVWAGNLVGAWNGGEAPIIGYGDQIGIVIVPFVLMDYWSLHYIDRPWYRDRDRWSHHRPPPPPTWHRPPPPPTDRHRPPPPREVPHRPPPGAIAPAPPRGPAPSGDVPTQRNRPLPVSPGASGGR